MKIGLIGNVQPWRTTSMTLYRARLRHAFSDHLSAESQCFDIDSDFRWGNKPGPLARWSYQLQRWAIYPREIQKKVRKLDLDIVHILDHSYGELTRVSECPSVVTVHDLIPFLMQERQLGNGPGSQIGRVGWSLFQRAVDGWHSADHLICVSENTYDDLIARFPDFDGKTSVVPHGIDDELLVLPKRTPVPETKTILHVGNNWSYKNVDGVVRAVAQLCAASRDRGVELEFVRVGPKLRPEQVAVLRKHGVRFQEYAAVEFEQLKKLYASAWLFVFPSLYEGFGWPPLEAMAAGTPVLSSAGGSLKSVVAPGAWTVWEDPTQSLPDSKVDDVLDLLEEECWLQASVDAQSYVQQFSWHKTAAATAAVYERIVKEAS